MTNETLAYYENKCLNNDLYIKVMQKAFIEESKRHEQGVRVLRSEQQV